jgi:hypothetical protein
LGTPYFNGFGCSEGTLMTGSQAELGNLRISQASLEAFPQPSKTWRAMASPSQAWGREEEEQSFNGSKKVVWFLSTIGAGFKPAPTGLPD